MKSLFFVTSAIHTKHGIYSAEQRLEQMIATLESIKTKVPESSILIIESSAAQSITEDEDNKLKPYVDGILNYNPDIQVQEIYNTSGNNWDIAKNLTELIVTAKSLNFALKEQPQLLNDINRVFKMSGRYCLNDNFDLSKHLDPLNKDCYLFAKRRASQFPVSTTNGLTQQIMSRLWSWPTHKTALVFFRYNLMMEDFIGLNHMGKYADIEHLLLKYFDGPYMCELDVMGVEGTIAPNGASVKD
jgi:hypothetical protein